jgi:release factor glutamine methyltransferase
VKTGESLSRTTRVLAEAGLPLPQIEAEGILRHILALDRADLFAALDKPMDASLVEAVDGLVRRRLAGEPLAYLVGHREFCGLEFTVDERVLVPREETELLVEQVLRYADGRSAPDLTVADVGTGSGAIAVAVARRLPGATVFATDISLDALAVADVNLRRHGVADRVHLLQGDLLEPLGRRVDVIVSNPPYVPTARIETLGPEVGREPRLALDGGAEGLDLVLRLLEEGPGYLKPDGRLVIEIDPDQLAPAIRAANHAFPESCVASSTDLLGVPRVLIVDTAGRPSDLKYSAAAHLSFS